MVPMIPAKKLVIDFLEGGVKDFKAGQNFYNLNNKVGKKNDSETNQSTGEGFLALLGFFWIVIACANYKHQATGNQKNQKNYANNGEGIVEDDGDYRREFWIGIFQSTTGPYGSVIDFDGKQVIHQLELYPNQYKF